MAYLHRNTESTLNRYLKRFPVVGISGPRQSGKSTLVQHVLTDYTYVTFDSMRNVDFFKEDPEGFMQVYSGKIIFDEVQYVPDLFRFIKYIVDKNRKKNGQFVLTGSAQFSFLAHVSESLAGRIGIFSVLPLQFSEVPKKYQKQSIYLGSYPELISTRYQEQALWYEAYLDTYLNKDLRTLANVGDLRDFRRFISVVSGIFSTHRQIS